MQDLPDVLPHDVITTGEVNLMVENVEHPRISWSWIARTGSVAAQNAGPAIVLSFIFAGVGCAFAGLCYAEFASLIPIAGSAYTYGYATLGEICDTMRDVFGIYEEVAIT